MKIGLTARARRTITGAVLSMALTTVAWATPWKIQPGVGVGPVLLGDGPKVADSFLSRGEVIQDGGILKWITYKEGLELHMDHGKVLQIVVHKPVLSTKHGPVEIEAPGGIKVGTTVAQMQQALGRDSVNRDLKVARSQPAETYYAYTKLGIGLIARQGSVFQITVWPKKP